MEQKHKNIAIIMVIGGIILLSLGITYAYFAARITGNEKASTLAFSTGVLTIEYADQTSTIEMSGIYPRREAWATKEFSLTGTNSIEKKMNYEIILNVTENSFPDNYIAYTLSSINESENGRVATSDYKFINNIGEKTIGYGYFDPDSVDAIHKYILNIYFIDNGLKQNDGQHKKFKANVFIDEAGIGETIIGRPEGWDDAIDGTLLAGIKQTNPTINLNCSKAGRAAAEGNEGLCHAADDYGESYYFRGAVENNYVSFAGMCWRIVRVDGKGNIKLVLFNIGENNTNTENPCSVENNGDGKAVYNNRKKYNDSNSSNTYIGFMFGNAGSESYEEEHSNETKSIILNELISFYDSKSLNNYDNILADVVWCNDKSVNDGHGTGVGANNTYYAGYDRLHDHNTATPTFKCPDSNGITLEGKNLSRFTAGTSVDSRGNSKLNFIRNGEMQKYKIGLLTADETAYAGATMGISNTSYYLYQNAKYWWWTITPFTKNEVFISGYSRNGASLLYHSLDDNGYNGEAGLGEAGIRPSIALVTSVTYTTTSNENKGTSENPFIIGA